MFHVKTSLLALLCIAQLPCPIKAIDTGEKIVWGIVGTAIIAGAGYGYKYYKQTTKVKSDDKETEKKQVEEKKAESKSVAAPKQSQTPAPAVVKVEPTKSTKALATNSFKEQKRSAFPAPSKNNNVALKPLLPYYSDNINS